MPDAKRRCAKYRKQFTVSDQLLSCFKDLKIHIQTCIDKFFADQRFTAVSEKLKRGGSASSVSDVAFDTGRDIPVLHGSTIPTIFFFVDKDDEVVCILTSKEVQQIIDRFQVRYKVDLTPDTTYRVFYMEQCSIA